MIVAWRVFALEARFRGLATALTAAHEHVVALEAARAALERLVESLPVAVYRGDVMPDGSVRRGFLTTGIERVTGWTAEQIPDQNAYLALVHDEDRPAALAHYGDVLRDGEATAEYRLQRPDGSWGWFSQRTRTVAVSDGVTELISTLSDVTSEYELTEQAAANEARFRGFLEASPDAMIIIDEAGQIVIASHRVEALFGYRPAELISQPYDILVPARRRGTHADHVRGYFGAPKVLDVGGGEPVYGLRRDGSEFPAEISLSPYRSAQGLFVIAAVRDISSRLQALEQQRQAQKMEAVGQLTGGIAHDFNNLLTMILGNTELLEWGDKTYDTETTALIAAIRLAGQRAALLTQQLLAFSRKQALTPDVVDLSLLIGRMSDMLRRTLGEHIVVEVIQTGDLGLAHVDANQFENAILNCAINARDAMPDGGRLTIETRDAAPVRCYPPASGDPRGKEHLTITISDTGAGMTKETLRCAFDPFYTTKPEGRGTGLGLSQVYGFVKQSGGQVELHSELGRGSTVTISLPRHLANDEQPAKSPHLPEIAPAHGTEKILVVEDQSAVREFSCTALTYLGYHVLAADSSTVALAILEQDAGVVLLFTDMGLPGINGRQLANAARIRRPGLKVLFTSGYGPIGIRYERRLDPGMHLLTKPYTIESLARRVRDILDDLPSEN
jgi:PAS domain S-box-containing protein